MVNVLNIAGKEFRDLCNSWMILVILSVFILSIINTVYDFYSVVIVAHGETGEHLLSVTLDGVWYVITYYGMFVGIVIGVCSISGERYGNALSTLVTKPLYRDNIINGKLLGALCFIACILLFAVVLFTSAMFAICGNSFLSIFTSYMQSLPLVFFVAVCYVLVYFSLAMLVSILIKNQALAMILVFLLLFIFDISRSATIGGALSAVFSDESLWSKIASLSPMGISSNIERCMFPPIDLPIGFKPVAGFMPWDQVAIIILYLIILLVMSYIAFVRRDIS